ncbi:MAG: redox-sensitive bicupin YhaK (pirin superfamily), partial [Patescibacteria group bacterium]
MKKTIQRSNERGDANHGWLHARFSFSFSEYYNPKRMGFGKIRVLNDDTIAPGKGFGAHPHDNMEIISIPTEGQLAHKDNTGAQEVIIPGQIQVMSAGSGIIHSEYNYSNKEETRLFQIWIETNKINADPRHITKTLDLGKNKLTKVVSGDKEEDTAFIYQDASISLGNFDTETTIEVKPKKERGTFIMIIEG